MLLAHTSAGFLLFGTPPTFNNKLLRSQESSLRLYFQSKTWNGGKTSDDCPPNICNNLSNKLNHSEIIGVTVISSDIADNSVQPTSKDRVFKRFSPRQSVNTATNTSHATQATHLSRESKETTYDYLETMSLGDTTSTKATEAAVDSARRQTLPTISVSLKASTNATTYPRKTTINFERSQILNFSRGSKSFTSVIAVASVGELSTESSATMTTRGTPLTTRSPQSSLPKLLVGRLSPSPETSVSSASSSPSSLTSTFHLSRFLMVDKFLKEGPSHITPSHNKGPWKRTSEKLLFRRSFQCSFAFHPFPGYFPSQANNEPRLTNKRWPMPLTSYGANTLSSSVSSATATNKFDDKSNAVVSKSLRQRKRDYREDVGMHEITSSTVHDWETRRKKTDAPMEGWEMTNTGAPFEPSGSSDRNPGKSMRDVVSGYDKRDKVDYDNDVYGRDGIDIEKVTIPSNLQSSRSSHHNLNSKLETSDLKFAQLSSNLATTILESNSTIQEDSEEEEEEEEEEGDYPIVTFWSVPKNWKSYASKKKGQMFRNLTILPLGMLLVFLVLVILQFSRWCLEDIRESDGPHLNYTYHLSILGGRDHSMLDKNIASRSLCDANIYEIPARPKPNVYGRNGNRKQKHLSRYLLRGNSAPNGASEGLAYGCRGVVELMMKSSAGMLSNRSLASFDCPFMNIEQYSSSAPRLSETPRGSQQTLELSYLHNKKSRVGGGTAHAGDKKLSGNKKHSKRVSRSLNNFKSEPRLAANQQHRSTRLSTLKKGSSTESASNSSLLSLSQQQQQKKKQQKRWQRQNRSKRQNDNLFECYSGQTLGSLLVMPSRLVVAPMAVASPSATVSTLLSSNSSSTAIHPSVCPATKQNPDIYVRTRHHSSPASSNSIRALRIIPSENIHVNESQFTKTSANTAKRLQKQHYLDFELKEGDSTYKLLESDYESLVELQEPKTCIQRRFTEENESRQTLSQKPEVTIEPVNRELSINNYILRDEIRVDLKSEDYKSSQTEFRQSFRQKSDSIRPTTNWRLPLSLSDSSSVGKHPSCPDESLSSSAFQSCKNPPRRSKTMTGESWLGLLKIQ